MVINQTFTDKKVCISTKKYSLFYCLFLYLHYTTESYSIQMKNKRENKIIFSEKPSKKEYEGIGGEKKSTLSRFFILAGSHFFHSLFNNTQRRFFIILHFSIENEFVLSNTKEIGCKTELKIKYFTTNSTKEHLK